MNWTPLSQSEAHLFFITNAADDGKVSLQEYMTFLQVPLDIAQPIFNVYDQDKDGFIEQGFLTQYYHLLDHNSKLVIDYSRTKMCLLLKVSWPSISVC